MPISSEEISKQLSYVLRHNPSSVGLELDSHGWAEVDKLLSCLAQNGTEISLADLRSLVDSNAKKRFAFSDDGTRIKANQGHSLKLDFNYPKLQPPEFLYHGTASRFIASIKEQGLLKQSRHHVHLTEDSELALEVGRRYGKAVLLTVDAASMAAAGIDFFKSENSVWLCDSIPSKFIGFPD